MCIQFVSIRLIQVRDFVIVNSFDKLNVKRLEIISGFEAGQEWNLRNESLKTILLC